MPSQSVLTIAWSSLSQELRETTFWVLEEPYANAPQTKWTPQPLIWRPVRVCKTLKRPKLICWLPLALPRSRCFQNNTVVCCAFEIHNQFLQFLRGLMGRFAHIPTELLDREQQVWPVPWQVQANTNNWPVSKWVPERQNICEIFCLHWLITRHHLSSDLSKVLFVGPYYLLSIHSRNERKTLFCFQNPAFQKRRLKITHQQTHHSWLWCVSETEAPQLLSTKLHVHKREYHQRATRKLHVDSLLSMAVQRKTDTAIPSPWSFSKQVYTSSWLPYVALVNCVQPGTPFQLWFSLACLEEP